MSNKIPYHQWTHTGDEVLVVRFSDHQGKSYGGFRYPMIVGETVTAPDWNDRATSIGGIHGWPWALRLGNGKECDFAALWQVYSVDPKDIVLLDDKVKFRTGILRYTGTWHGANDFVISGQMAWVFHNSRGSASNSGDRGSASNSGYSGSASNSGYSGSASNSGYRGSASNSGYRGSASNSGYSGSASNSGEEGCAFALGVNAIAMSSIGGWITLAEWSQDANSEWHRVNVKTVKVDGKKIKADTYYKLIGGKFIEVSNA